jgi:23S rRNA pseudouridine2605 synthase
MVPAMTKPPAEEIPETKTSETQTGEKIAKVLAHAGVASRRQAEELVRLGKVAIAGQVVTDPATRVGGRTEITVDGKPVARQTETRLWRYHKPAGEIVTDRDDRGRKTIFSSLPADMPRVVSVGRLDLNSEGLLLLTNDGELARWLELPSTGWKRKYRVRAYGTPPSDLLLQLAKGVTVDGVSYGPMEATLDRDAGPNIWLTLGLREGKNREIRKVLEHFGLRVNRLIRTAYGPFQLGTLGRGEVEAVSQRILLDQASPFFRESGRPVPKTGPQAKAKPKTKPRPRPAPKAGAKAPAGKPREAGKLKSGKSNENRRRPS